jgi:hypothetical protein
MWKQVPPGMEELAEVQTDALKHRSQVVDNLATTGLLYSFLKL